MKVTIDLEDGSTPQDLFDQAHVDAAVATAVAAVPAAPIVAPEDREIDVQVSDGTTKTFVPKV